MLVILVVTMASWVGGVGGVDSLRSLLPGWMAWRLEATGLPAWKRNSEMCWQSRCRVVWRGLGDRSESTGFEVFFGGGGGCPFEKNAEFSWIFGFFVRLKCAGESEGWTQELRQKNQRLKKYLQKSATENAHPQILKKSFWPFSKIMIFLPHPQ